MRAVGGDFGAQTQDQADAVGEVGGVHYVEGGNMLHNPVVGGMYSLVIGNDELGGVLVDVVLDGAEPDVVAVFVRTVIVVRLRELVGKGRHGDAAADGLGVDVIRIVVLVHAAELGAVLKRGEMAAQVPAERARTLGADVDLLLVARLTLGPGEDVVLGAVDLVKTCRAPLGQVVVRGRGLVELARAGAGGVGEVAGVERIVAKVARSDGGAPRVPGIGQNMGAAELNAV